MNERVDIPREPILTATTPAGLQANAELQLRRQIVLVLVCVTYVALMAVAASIVSTGGWSVVGWLMLVCFGIGTPWTVLGFWNAVIGLWLLHGAGGWRAKVAPFAAAGNLPTPVVAQTAIIMTLRNEDPARAVARLESIKAGVDATAHGSAFAYFLLSDSDVPAVVAQEEALAASWKTRDPQGGAAITYRRRAINTGFKAGNVQAFCEQEGRAFDLMIPLDADSVMGAEAILALVRMMQAYPKLGIIQSLVVGMPSLSPFARLFQFGMRHGMRAYTMGQAWWTADCGPFWGHNAIVRIAPLRDACGLPVLPGGPPFGGVILSHDQVEAVLMRRAGYEVRVLPFEGGSYEENPPSMLDFLVRDVRWCHGNLQYLRLLDLRGIEPMSRFQLIWAIAMFVGIPAWMSMIALLPFATLHFQDLAAFPVERAQWLYATFFALYLAPKTAGLIDAALTKGEVARFGGVTRFVLGALAELVFSFLQGAISTVNTTIFMVGLLLGQKRTIAWDGQQRDARGIRWSEAARVLWPQTLFGVLICGSLWVISPVVFAWSLPLTLGYLVAIPFCVVTADPRLGLWMARHGLAGIPEDFVTPSELQAIMTAPRTSGSVAE